MRDCQTALLSIRSIYPYYSNNLMKPNVLNAVSDVQSDLGRLAELVGATGCGLNLNYNNALDYSRVLSHRWTRHVVRKQWRSALMSTWRSCKASTNRYCASS